MANLNVDGALTATTVTAQQTLNCDSSNIWFGGAQCVESGSNANGYWARYYDGTQICCGRYVADGYNYHTFPQPFINTDYYVTKAYYDTTSTSQMPLRIMTTNNRSETRFESYDVERAPAQYIAIGRWK